MKEFFSHDHNARNDKKLTQLQMKHGMAGIGIFWCICEMLAEEDGYLMRTECERIAYELRTSCDTVKSVIEDYALFTLDEHKFYSESMLKRLKVKYDKSQKARQSAEIRWNKMNDDANALQTHSDRNAIKLNKTDIKQNEIKLNINPKKDLSVIDQNQTDLNSFNHWWNLYAKKVDQKKCFAKWKKYDHETRLMIWRHTKKYVEATPDKQFRRNPLTYLNGENWNDTELLQPKAKNAAADQKVTVADFFRDTIRAEVPSNGIETREQKQLSK